MGDLKNEKDMHEEPKDHVKDTHKETKDVKDIGEHKDVKEIHEEPKTVPVPCAAAGSSGRYHCMHASLK